MRKGALLLMAGLAIATLTAAPAMAARPDQSAAMPDLGLAPNTPWADAPLAILYTQYDNSGTSLISSQNFEAAYDIYDDFAADDFVVPANTSWKITGVGVQGGYFDVGQGPVDSFNVLVYTDGGGIPGVLRVTKSNMTYTLNGTDQFRIKVSPAITVPASPSPRHLWIAVQANMDANPKGQWGWTTRTVQSNDPAAWENPGGGFLICPNWGDLATCIGITDPDFVYLLFGTSTP